jgi:hypothetical protein
MTVYDNSDLCNQEGREMHHIIVDMQKDIEGEVQI